jgi:hypothetical protein
LAIEEFTRNLKRQFLICGEVKDVRMAGKTTVEERGTSWKQEQQNQAG